MSPDAPHVDRAKGCLLGQLCGDALGAIVEFGTPENIRLAHPGGLREMIASPVFNTLPGQITDDSEMALALARAVIGPTVYDRVLSVNMFGTKTVLLLAVIAFLYGRPDFLDLALAYALINFIGVLAVLEFFRSRARHSEQEQEPEDLAR